MTGLWRASIAAAVLLGGGGLAPLAAQSLAQRVAAAPDGTVHFAFALRPGVCGQGESFSTSRRTTEWESRCDDGPGRIALDVIGRRVAGLRFYIGGRWRAGAPVSADLGTVPAGSAAAYLLDLASSTDPAVARRAIEAAALADSAVVWPRLLDIARDASRPQNVRRSATFWVAQSAAAEATRGLVELAESPGDREVRQMAVFALSQQPADDALPALIRVAETSRDPDLRRKAIFWLGQSKDPRALEFLRRTLEGR